VLSIDADASRVVSCEKATDLTQLLWLLSVCRHAQLLASQILTVLSSDADASRVESCEKATDMTAAMALECLQACAAARVPDLDGVVV
jgi:hypothetical protein